MSNYSSRDLKPLLHVGSGIRLSANDIILLEAKANYTEVSLSSGKKIKVSTNLGAIEERLEAYDNFIRPNRQVIVNLSFFENYTPNYLYVKGMEIKVSRRRKPGVLQMLKAMNIN